MAFTDEQLTTMRTSLGVAEDADEATILAALDEALEERADAPNTPTAREGYEQVSQAELATLRAGAAAGTQAAQTLHERDREAFLDANRAKIPTALRDSWAAQYDRDPRRHAHLAGLDGRHRPPSPSSATTARTTTPHRPVSPRSPRPPSTRTGACDGRRSPGHQDRSQDLRPRRARPRWPGRRGPRRVPRRRRRRRLGEDPRDRRHRRHQPRGVHWRPPPWSTG